MDNKNIHISESSEHENPKNIEEAARPAAYARILARIPKYASKAMEVARPLAYASEVGESFRHVFPKIVKPLYALSIGYVFGDIGVKYYNAKHKNSEYLKWYMIDLSLWHLGASLVLPAVVINRYIHTVTNVLAKRNLNTKLLKFFPLLSALVLIPFIVHPLDHFTDYAMDNTFRKYKNYKLYDDSPNMVEEKTHH
jgi:mitochondrial fission process protein 1